MDAIPTKKLATEHNVYDLLEFIGSGTFGQVFKGRNESNRGNIVAIKRMSKENSCEKDIDMLRQEMNILSRLDHHNIIALLDHENNPKEFVVVMEFASGGDLSQVLETKKNLGILHVKDIAIQMIQAVHYLHCCGVVHRDIKPQNILVDQNGTIKLCDFGFAKSFSCNTFYDKQNIESVEKDVLYDNQMLNSIKGTPVYMAPELMREDPYNYRVDIWSLGVMFFELFTGNPPFYSKSIFSLMENVLKDPIPDICTDYNKDGHDCNENDAVINLKSLLDGLLQKNPSSRIKWRDLLNHSFLKIKDRESDVEMSVDRSRLVWDRFYSKASESTINAIQLLSDKKFKQRLMTLENEISASSSVCGSCMKKIHLALQVTDHALSMLITGPNSSTTNKFSSTDDDMTFTTNMYYNLVLLIAKKIIEHEGELENYEQRTTSQNNLYLYGILSEIFRVISSLIVLTNIEACDRTIKRLCLEHLRVSMINDLFLSFFFNVN